MTPADKVCAACGLPVAHEEAGADVRLYLGPGDKLAELWLPLCEDHLERFGEAHRRDTVECRVARVSRGAGRFL
jgi:hypothetical protein